MSTLDPATGNPLPNDAIQRVLFVCNPVHVYAIPPLMSMKGYTAADWTTPDPQNDGKTKQIFTARLRIIETSIPPSDDSSPSRDPGNKSASEEQVKTDILLEDPSTGSLFAGAPYTDDGVVQHAVDSSRFFALRVMGDGRKAVLGIGFEDRSEAFDFGVTLQEARKFLGFGTQSSSTTTTTTTTTTSEPPAQSGPSPQMPRGPSAAPSARAPRGTPGRAPPGRMVPPGGGNVAARGAPQTQTPQATTTTATTAAAAAEEKPATSKDYSLKPGQSITINIGGKKGSGPQSSDSAKGTTATSEEENNKALFSIPPPPGLSASTSQSESDPTPAFPVLAPPPSARDSRSDRRRKPPTSDVEGENKPPDPFDDDDFGDFQ